MTKDPAFDPGLARDTSAVYADLTYGHQLALAFLDRAQITTPADKVGRRAGQLFLRILELAGECLALHDAKFFTPIPIVARSSVEAVADLLCLQKDPAHLDSIDLRNLNQDHMLWSDPNALQNEAVKKGLEHPTAAEDFEWLKSKREALEGATYRIKKVFKEAGLEQTYAVRYNRLSVEAHNNGSSLYERHVGIDPISGAKGPAYLKYPTQATELGLDSARHCLKIGLNVIAEMFNRMELLRELDGLSPKPTSD